MLLPFEGQRSKMQSYSPSPAGLSWLLCFSLVALCTRIEDDWAEASCSYDILAYFHGQDVYRHKARAWRKSEPLQCCCIPILIAYVSTVRNSQSLAVLKVCSPYAAIDFCGVSWQMSATWWATGFPTKLHIAISTDFVLLIGHW